MFFHDFKSVKSHIRMSSGINLITVHIKDEFDRGMCIHAINNLDYIKTSLVFV